MTTYPTAEPMPLHAPAADLPRLDGLRVLCVDDNADSADSLGALLRLCGAEVEVCHDGPSAVAAFVTFAPQACVLDVTMPEMDGCELAEWIRSHAGDRPILIAAVTALDGTRAYEREADAGFDLHFTKPADPVELAEALRDFAAQQGR